MPISGPECAEYKNALILREMGSARFVRSQKSGGNDTGSDLLEGGKCIMCLKMGSFPEHITC